VSRLDDDEKIDDVGITDTVGRKNYATAINESGLYSLIFQSRKPEAKAFRKWVTGEVLPSLRRTGTYAVHDNDCCSATLWRHRKYGPPQLTAPRMGEWLDLRDIPYSTIPLNDYRVRIIRHNDVDWYSVNDILKATNNSTSSCDVVRRLNANRTIAIRIFIYGNTHPAWFCTLTGMQLIVCGKKTEGGSHGN
jgi:prophage antirepressor-like protein